MPFTFPKFSKVAKEFAAKTKSIKALPQKVGAKSRPALPNMAKLKVA